MKSKNSITLFLMISSMALLIILQVFWLHGAYERAFYAFRGRTSEIFRGAVFAVRDSTMFQKMEALPRDSAIDVRSNIQLKQNVDPKSLPKIYGTQTVNIRQQGSKTEMVVYSKSTPDSVKSMIRVFADRMDKGKMEGNTQYVIRFNNDSLNLDSISAQFSRALGKANLKLSFDVKKFKTNFLFHSRPIGPGFERAPMRRSSRRDTLSVFGSTVQSEWIRVDPMNEYAAVINGLRPVLLKEIAPQIFFSGVLTFVTSLSFIFMYRNIRSQQRLMILKNDFISNITHELKTPIATVSVALEALKNFKGIDDPRRTKEYLDIAQQELSRLAILTDKVLTTSLFDENGIKIEFEKVNLDEIIHEVLGSLKLVFEKHGASVELQKKGDDFTVEGSHVHLTNVIHNLIDNALKYSLSSPVIILGMVDQGTKIILTISDKGIGIPSEFHNKVFEKFFRMPTGDIHNIKGYGLGLSYVDSVIKSHHGTIGIDSQPGMGSTFTITLPKVKG